MTRTDLDPTEIIKAARAQRLYMLYKTDIHAFAKVVCDEFDGFKPIALTGGYHWSIRNEDGVLISYTDYVDLFGEISKLEVRFFDDVKVRIEDKAVCEIIKEHYESEHLTELHSMKSSLFWAKQRYTDRYRKPEIETETRERNRHIEEKERRKHDPSYHTSVPTYIDKDGLVADKPKYLKN